MNLFPDAQAPTSEESLYIGHVAPDARCFWPTDPVIIDWDAGTMISKIQPGVQALEKTGTKGSQSALPAAALSLVFLALSILTWPKILEKFMTLDWRIGNMRPVAYALQAVLAALTMATVLGSKRVASWFYKTFSSGKHFFFAAATALLSVAFCLILAEGAMRLLHLPFRAQYTSGEGALARFDPELGWSYIPNHAVTQEFGTANRRVPTYTDELGCRIGAPGDRADRSRPTVLFVGDSFTFGHGVTYEESFVGQLAAMPGFRWQVVNLGVQGYGTDQALLMLKRHFKKFNVKTVVYTWPLAVGFDRNEVYDRRTMHPHELFVGTKPLFALRPDGSLYLAKTPVQYKDYSYSRLWASFEILRIRWGPRFGPGLTRALIKEMRDFTESNGAKFIGVEWEQGNSLSSEHLADPFSPDMDVIRTGANPPPGWPTWFVPGDVHPGPRAHRYVAGLLAKELERVVHD